MYAVNHGGSVYNTLLIACAFLLLKYQISGFPASQDQQVLEAGVLGFCAVMFLRQRGVYRWIAGAKIKEADCAGIAFNVAFGRFCYLVPWMWLLFEPLRSSFVGTHLLGYAFVFCVTAAYSSASSRT